jgi:hypothetical protein
MLFKGGSLRDTETIALESKLNHLVDQLLHHPVYPCINSLETLRLFMESHVYAVWDFMSLTHALRRQLSSPGKLWTPGASPRHLRMIYTILLDEETDIWEELDGKRRVVLSHFELYLKAMDEVHANREGMDALLDTVQSTGGNYFDPSAVTELHRGVASFLDYHLELVKEADLARIAGAFYFGREAILPDLFERVIAQPWFQKNKAPLFVTYCQHHVHLDGDVHGGMAEELFEYACAGDSEKRHAGLLAGIATLKARHRLLDGIHQGIQKMQTVSGEKTKGNPTLLVKAE